VKRLLIIGTGGQGKVVLDSAASTYDTIAFMTNDLHGHGIDGHEILHEQETPEEYISSHFDEIIVAIGNNSTRLNLSLKYEARGMKLATIVHPRAVVSKHARVEAGTVILANAVVNPFAIVKKACIINSGSIVEHDCILEDGVHVSPNATMGGMVKIGKRTWICLGSSIANNITIGENVIVGAGSVVLRDIPDNVLVAGVPGTIRKKI
jgi:sugar O-acyltransferase (sialic acid O-acetyltransferase NeuD family)